MRRPAGRDDAAVLLAQAAMPFLRLDTVFAKTLVRVPTATDVFSTEVLVRGESELAAARDVALCPLNARLSAHGLTLAQITSSRYRVPQRLSRRVHEAYPAIDGILYISRFDGGHCVALFDRARDAITATGVTRRPLTPQASATAAGAASSARPRRSGATPLPEA